MKKCRTNNLLQRRRSDPNAYLVATYDGQLKEVNYHDIEGRFNRMHRGRELIGGEYFETCTLERIVDKHTIKDEETGEVVKWNEWGVALKREGRRVVPMFDLLLHKGEHILRN